MALELSITATSIGQSTSATRANENAAAPAKPTSVPKSMRTFGYGPR
jgi:hypothetical protein